MMYLDKPPQLVETRMFSSMPAEFAWCFLEMGGCQPRAHPGGLFHRRAVIRYPFGRIFRIPRDDLHIASYGDIYFTDQGQTGVHDPSAGCSVCPAGRLDCLISDGPRANALVLSPDEAVLFVAMTRDKSIWRVPLMRDGGAAKV